MNRYWRWIGVALSIACLVFFGMRLHQHWQAVDSLAIRVSGLWALGMATLVYLMTHGVAVFAWRFSLRSVECHAPLRELARIQLLSQFGKYLPGNVGQHLGKLSMAAQYGLPKGQIFASMLIDTFAVLIAAGICSLPAFDLIRPYLAVTDTVRIGLVVVSLLSTVAVASLFVGRVRRYAIDTLRLHAIKQPSAIPLAILTHGTNFVAGTATLWLVAHAFGSSSLSSALPLCGVFSAAWLLGFLIPGAPAGVGVRDAVLLVGLSPLVGSEGATMVSAFHRIITTVGDCLAFGLGWSTRALWPDAAHSQH